MNLTDTIFLFRQNRIKFENLILFFSKMDVELVGYFNLDEVDTIYLKEKELKEVYYSKLQHDSNILVTGFFQGTFIREFGIEILKMPITMRYTYI